MTKPTRVTNSIRSLRAEHGQITQGELADLVGVTRQTLNAIEQARYSPSLEVAFRIAAVLGVTLEEVFGFAAAAPQAAKRRPMTRSKGEC
jgi:putative transcriptional regulator